jgi:hypothetical protein
MRHCVIYNPHTVAGVLSEQLSSSLTTTALSAELHLTGCDWLSFQ